MPGARRFRMVTTKLSAAMTDEVPRKRRPSSQKSVWGPIENGFSVSVAYPYQPACGALSPMQAGRHEEAAEEEDPEGEGVQPGERDVPGPDHERAPGS